MHVDAGGASEMVRTNYTAAAVLAGKAGGTCDIPDPAGVEAMAEQIHLEAACTGAKGRQGSQVQQGCLRLELSSEEDPLLCTQRMPSTQGKQQLLLHPVSKTQQE